MMDTSFTHFRVFFHKVSLIINTRFTTFHETLYARHVKFFAEASELFMYIHFQFVIHKMASSDCILQGAKMMAVTGAISGL